MVHAKTERGLLKPVVNILAPCKNELKVLFLYWHLCCGWKTIVMDVMQISTPTDNLEIGQHFNHNIQRRLSYKSFVERKWLQKIFCLYMTYFFLLLRVNAEAMFF
jgi:hypothetical protein